MKTKANVMMNGFLVAGLLLSSSLGFAQDTWEHFWIDDSMRIGGSLAISPGLSIRLSFVRDQQGSKQLARDLYVDLYGLRSDVCDLARIVLTNRKDNTGRPNTSRESLQVDLKAQPEGHCSAHIPTGSTFVDDPDPARNGQVPGSNYEYILKEGAQNSEQTLWLELGRIPFLAGFQLAK